MFVGVFVSVSALLFARVRACARAFPFACTCVGRGVLGRAIVCLYVFILFFDSFSICLILAFFPCPFVLHFIPSRLTP